MTNPSRRLILTVSLLALASLITSRISTAQTGVTWTGLSGATTSGSALTPTAANGRGESSQSIPAGNGSLKVFAYSYPDGNFLSFGLTNIATFTGAAAEIDYGWRTYGTAANCRKDGDSLNGFINITNGDSLEVRINGTTVEYYHNSTLVTDCTLTNQTLSYPYRAAATFTASSAPPISSATMTGMDNLVPPTTLAATNGSGNNINLSWAYTGAGQAGFKIERKLGKSSTYAEIATVGASTLTYSDTGSKTANRVYTYRVRAYKTGENGPYSAFAQATTPYTGGGSIKTDRAVYTEPTLPPLPHAGGKWRDEVFGTEIMRASDDDDCSTQGAGTFYNQWPTFNSDNTRILMRCETSGDMIIKSFDPVNFKLGTTLRKTWGGGATQTPTIGGEYAQWQGATWSRTDPDKIWVVPMAPNSGGSTSRGPQIYTYSVSANTYTPVKSFVSTFATGQYFFEYHFAGTHADGDYDVFTASVNPEQNGSAAHWFAWQRTGDRVIFNHDNANVTHYNVCVPAKGGDYIYCGPDFGYTTRKIYRVSDLAEQDISSAPLSVHGDVGTVWNVARNVQGTLMPQERRTISDWNNTALAIFDWKDANGVQDASNDCHTSLAADNEDWVMEGCYDDPNGNTPGFLYETGAFEDEIIQIATDGSQRIRRLVHHRSLVDNLSSTTGYWAAPKPTISLNGRFIAFTSNWENSGRTDLFILRVPRAPFLALQDDFNDNSRDPKKWLVNALGSAVSDPNVAVAEQNQRLEITPLSNTGGAHSNGYSTANLIDMTNRRARVEVVQATNTASWANTVFSLAGDDGWYRFLTEHGQLYAEQYVNGVGSGATPITYSSTTHRHWRIRHDPSNDTIYWETSSDGSTWTVRHSATRQLDITKLVADLYVRTWQSESSPGVAVFDNFKFESGP
jgi:hypothetical protein